MGRLKPTATTPRWPKYDMLTPEERMGLRNRIHPKIESRRELMKKRGILEDKGIHLDGFPEESPIRSTIHNFGWEHFCAPRGEYDPEIVREFYAALNSGIFNEFGEVFMKNTRVVMTHRAIKDLYHLPDIEESDLTKMLGGVPRIEGVGDREERSGLLASALRRDGHTRWTTGSLLKKNELHIDIAFWMKFLKASVTPSKNSDVVDSTAARMLYCIQQGKAMDIPKIIRLEILDAARSTDVGVLPFPCLITHFCKSAGIPSRAPCIVTKDFTTRTYNFQITYAGKQVVRTMHDTQDIPLRIRKADKQLAASDDDDDDAEYDPKEASTQPSIPRLTAPIRDTSVLESLEKKFDFVIEELKTLRSSIEHMETQLEEHGYGVGHLTSEKRKANKRRKATGTSSSHHG